MRPSSFEIKSISVFCDDMKLQSDEHSLEFVQVNDRQLGEYQGRSFFVVHRYKITFEYHCFLIEIFCMMLLGFYCCVFV